MRTTEKISEGTSYTAVSVGKMAELSEHTLVLAPGINIPGKVFVGKAIQANGGELSFQSFAPHTETGFLHTHKTHEELYIFISGKGEFQVDGKIFSVCEGSVVRVAPNGKRAVRNNGSEPLVMICVQYKANTFNESDATDGEILEGKVTW